jgi:hypothetical protein
LIASLVKKKKGNRLYYYLVESARVDRKPRIVHQAYLGTAEKLAELVQQGSAPIPLSATLRDFGLPGALWLAAKQSGLWPVLDPAAKAFGICLPHGERGLWEWEFYPAGMGRMNWSAPVLIASTRIRHLLKHLDELGVRTPA